MYAQDKLTMELPPLQRSESSLGAREAARTVAWQLPVLAAILALSAFLNFYQLDRVGYANTYYAAAVKSMMQTWHAFFFNSFDSAGFVTIDKPPLGFWFQVLSAKLFGYSAVSLLLPEALAGVLSVLLIYYLVRRWFGVPAGLLAALALAVTPVAVADNRNNIIDSILTLFLLLSIWAVMRAIETGKLRWLLLCAVIVGLGFNVKMLEAYLVVPALGLVYLLGAPVLWRTRLVHLLLAGVVMLAVSLSWVTAVDLTPASQRPWVDSTSSNSEMDLALGYNGLQRLLGNNLFGGGGTRRAATTSTSTGGLTRGSGQGGATQTGSIPPAGNAVPGSTTSPGSGSGPQAGITGNGTTAPTFGGGGGGLFNNGPAGPLRLINADLGGQAGWLLPLALIGLIAAGSRKLRFPLTRQHQGLVLWGAWLLTEGGFFSVAGFFHSYYLVTMAPPAAALVGIGLVALWQEYRQSSLFDWRGWLLPAALVVTAVAQAYILSNYADWSRWMSPLAIGGTVVAAVALIAARLLRGGRLPRLWAPVAASIGVLALLTAPTTWAEQTINAGGGGGVPSAGPASARGFGGFGGGRTGNRRFAGFAEFARAFENARIGTGTGAPGLGVNSTLLGYLEKHQGTTTYLFATTNSNSAAPYIIQTGKPVMSLGGFSGSNPILTKAQLQTLISDNVVRYFLLGGGGFGGGRGSNTVTTAVESVCTVVPASDWQSSTSSNTDDAAGFGAGAPPAGGFGGPGAPAGGQGGTVGGQGAPLGGQSSTAGGTGTPSSARGGFGGSQTLYYCGNNTPTTTSTGN